MDPTFQPTVDRLRKCISERDKDRRYFVDFDYTLLMANSTDKYLQSARPAFIFRPLLKLIGFIRPWKLRGSNSVFLYRDATRLSFLQGLRPALAADFDLIADREFDAHQNQQLVDMLSSVESDRIVIVSFGLKSTIEAMLRSTRFSGCPIVASSPDRLVEDRRRGKLEMLQDAKLTPDSVLDVVVTDSKFDDQDLLEFVEHAFHIKWQ